MRHIGLTIVVCSCLIQSALSMSRVQLKKSGKMMQKTCMPKNSVELDQVADIEQGKFIEDPNVMCYIACIYQMIGMVKNNKLDYDTSIKQVNTLFPPELRGPTIEAIEACKATTRKYKDLCQSSYYTAVCMYNHDPANFFFA